MRTSGTSAPAITATERPGLSLLAGVRVIDLTTVIAGPYASFQLSLLGADVIKVERPDGGDTARHLGPSPELCEVRMGTSFIAQNSGKRSVTIDLKAPAGKHVFERLVANADVLLENMRPGVIERLGFGWPRLRELNPRLVYCGLSGFGATGSMVAQPAYDQIVQGRSGMIDVTGWADRDGVRVGFPLCDTLGGLGAALAICAGLAARERTGEGCQLDVSMLETAMSAMGWVVADYLIGGVEPRRRGNDNASSSPSGTFRTGDGDLVIAANTEVQFASICEVLGRTELLSDPRFATRADRVRHRQELRDELELGLARGTAAEWEARLGAVRVPAGRVLTLPDALAQQQLVEREFIAEVDVRGLDAPRSAPIMTGGIRVNGAVPRPAGPPPLLGEHTVAVLSELGFSEQEIEQLGAEGTV